MAFLEVLRTGHLNRVDEVFERVVALRQLSREAALNLLCRGDPRLQLEVAKLLEAHDRAEQSTEFLATAQIEDALFSDSPSCNDPLIGQHIGPYEIKRWLGGGGFGDVYLASRSTEYRQTVAVKVFRGNKHQLRRFELERQLLADLDHEHIARIFDGGSLTDGRAYIVMEYVNGQPITCCCDQIKLHVIERSRLFTQVCQAVAYAHRHGVVHRDIKPGNILVTERGWAKLLNFGIAKLLDGSLRSSEFVDDPRQSINAEIASEIVEPSTIQAVEASNTSPGAVGPMTPAYASPEQVCGQQLSAASDIYSLGVVLYELLTGCRPYEFQCNSLDEIRSVVCGEKPRKPSDVVLDPSQIPGRKSDGPSAEILADARDTKPRLLRLYLWGDLEQIILKALAKDPQERYQTVEEFLQAFAKYSGRFLGEAVIGASADIEWDIDFEMYKAMQYDCTYELVMAKTWEQTRNYLQNVVVEPDYAAHFATDKRLAGFPWYVIGLRRQIEGNDKAAIEAFERCVELVADIDDAQGVRSVAQWRLRTLSEKTQKDLSI